jgi:hypothetical protein
LLAANAVAADNIAKLISAYVILPALFMKISISVNLRRELNKFSGSQVETHPGGSYSGALSFW